MSTLILDLMDKVNPVSNSSRIDSKPSGALNPALRGGTPYGGEPGIILKSNPVAASGSEEPLARREQRDIISNGVNSELRNLYSVFGMANFFMDDPDSLL